MSDFIFSLATRIEADETLKPIYYAADTLRRDMQDGLMEHGPENVIRVTLDDSVEKEAYRAEVMPEEIRLVCGDDLGAVYALLSVSERLLNVQPLDWWMGVHPKKFSTVSVPCQTWHSPAYRVRFRSWFVNDEVLFTGWHMEEAQRAEVWKRVFEALLRCGGNMIIPGTDREYDGTVLCQMALDRGLWLTQHHSEILGARMFGRMYPTLTPSYTLYPEKYEGLWQESIDRYAGKRVVWAIGFRGQGDHAFWDDDDGGYDSDQKRGAFISAVMRRQMELVLQKDPNARFSTNLYGELMALYRQGYLTVPENVIKLWGDNGFSKMVSRRQENLNPRTDAMPGIRESGENGIYYHVSFYDLQAANHITMLQIPPRMVADELKRVLERGADTLWNINVGSIRPHPFMIDLVSRVWRDGACDPDAAARDFAKTYLGTGDAGDVFTQYAESAVSYGPHPDDLAGDQYYHFPLRYLARALLRGETDTPVNSLLWAAGDKPFPDQVRVLAAVAAPGMESWKRYLRLCQKWEDELDETAGERLHDLMTVQAKIHLSGCQGLYAFCQACLHAVQGNDLQAYLWTDRALEAHRQAFQAMKTIPGRFAHIYDNDCFAGVGQTVQVLQGVRAFLRIRGDSERLNSWERQFITPIGEVRVTLQSHRTVPLTDDELCLQLRREVPLLPAE